VRKPCFVQAFGAAGEPARSAEAAMTRGQTPDRAVAAVVLAAGEASRFGAPKQRLLLPRVLARLAAAPVDDVVVVAGAHPLEDTAGAERVVTCPEWERGPGASLRCGLAALDAGTEAAVVVLADGPDLAPEAVSRVLAAWRTDAGPLVAASYGGVRGHPLLVARQLWESVPDEGFRALQPALVPCDDLGAPGDIDTKADLL
jgi:nicotine blue oxidoreductase